MNEQSLFKPKCYRLAVVQDVRRERHAADPGLMDPVTPVFQVLQHPVRDKTIVKFGDVEVGMISLCDLYRNMPLIFFFHVFQEFGSVLEIQDLNLSRCVSDGILLSDSLYHMKAGAGSFLICRSVWILSPNRLYIEKVGKIPTDFRAWIVYNFQGQRFRAHNH